MVGVLVLDEGDIEDVSVICNLDLLEGVTGATLRVGVVVVF